MASILSRCSAYHFCAQFPFVGCARLDCLQSGFCLRARKGEIVACVANVSAMDNLTPGMIADFREDILSCSVVVLDANMSRESLVCAASIAAEQDVPTIMEPVSVVKSIR